MQRGLPPTGLKQNPDDDDDDDELQKKKKIPYMIKIKKEQLSALQ